MAESSRVQFTRARSCPAGRAQTGREMPKIQPIHHFSRKISARTVFHAPESKFREATKEFNVKVLKDTGDFYRFFDATPHAEFLYDCVKRTIEHDLPYETNFLRRYDDFRRRIEGMIDMLERTIDLLFRFLSQNDGKLASRAREKELALTDEDVSAIEAIYTDVFGETSSTVMNRRGGDA